MPNRITNFDLHHLAVLKIYLAFFNHYLPIDLQLLALVAGFEPLGLLEGVSHP